MPELLIEIHSEEIPARMQNKAAEDFKKLFIDFFHKQNIKFSQNKVNAYCCPRRLVFVAEDLQEIQVCPAKKITGPQINAPQKAIEGFLKSVGVKQVSELSQIENKKGQYYCFQLPKKEIKTIDILQDHLPQILQKMSNLWPKTMRWLSGQNAIYWVRPIRNILAIFNQKIIPFKFGALSSNDKSYGHLFLSGKSFKVTNFADYNKKLADNFVTLDAAKRKEIIINGIKAICKKLNCYLVENLENDNQLLNEVAGLVEYPQVMYGQISQEFMSLPYEVLVLTVKRHQKYFCLKDKKGNLAPYFIFVSNVKGKDSNKIIADNEKVLSARLNDAKFFIEEDLKISLRQKVEDLRHLIFHEKLGSVFFKVKRLEALNKFIAIWIPHASLSLAEKLADLAKSDLVTKGVAELPELQGVIGKYYAQIAGEDNEVSQAIAEQYLPAGADSELPKTPLGVLLSIADKIDTICGLFLVNEKPTGSKDPFALRRLALGIIRIIAHYQIHLPLKIIIDKAINCFSIQTIKKVCPDKRGKEIKNFKKELSCQIMSFFIDRLSFFLKDQSSLIWQYSHLIIPINLHILKADLLCKI